MDVTPLIKSGQMVIESYGDQGIQINGERHTKSFCLYPDGLKNIDFNNISDLTENMLTDIPADVILVATGDEKPAEQVMRLKMMNANIEVMDIGSACRTYNVLLAEGRRVALIALFS